MALGVLRAEIVGVVGADQGDTRLLMYFQQTAVDLRLLGNTVVLKLQIEIIPAEYFLHLQGIFLGTVIVAVEDALGDFSGQARRESNETLGMCAQQIQVNAGLYIKALHESLTDHVGEVTVACLIFTQKHQVAGLGIVLMDLIEPRAGGHIDLAADDGMNALCLAGPVKINGTVHNAVVGDGTGGLA